MPDAAVRARSAPAGDLVEQVVAAALRSDGADLGVLAGVVGQGVGADWCTIDAGPEAAAQTSAGVGNGVLRQVIRYGGEPVGLLRLGVGPLARLHPARRRAVRQVAAALGPVLRAAALREERDRLVAAADRVAAAVAASRREAVAAQEKERRALERDLHDGAQHHLVALRMAVGLLEHELGAGEVDVEAAQTQLAYLTTLLDVTERGLAATATGTLPSALMASGLVAALEAELPAAPSVRVDADPAVRSRRYPLPVEVTVFFTCLEAVNNAAKHAPGAAVEVRLGHSSRGLAFAVRDDGPGFDPSTLSPRSGLHLLRDRVAAAGGELVLRSAPGTGTALEGFIPV